MPEGRAVRIPKGRSVELGGGAEPPSAPPGVVRENRGGTQRATRTFLAFLVGLVAVYGVFLSLVLSAARPGERSDLAANALFTLILVAFGLAAYVLTVAQAPRRVRVADGEFVVTERFGRIRRFANGPPLIVRVVKRYAPGPLADTATEIVLVTTPEGGERTYLVERGLVPATPEGTRGS
ncbi:MAG: hypothetical protein L3J93_04565 [Thermoplasmata archaeon]|nr:hypothetical protein [Thermoplasmata archaeon]